MLLEVAMSNVVRLQKKFYRMIIRVVMDGQAFYHAAVVRCTKEPMELSLKEIKNAFSVVLDEHWTTGALINLDAAHEALKTKAIGIETEPDGVFVTIRPNSHNEPISIWRL